MLWVREILSIWRGGKWNRGAFRKTNRKKENTLILVIKTRNTHVVWMAMKPEVLGPVLWSQLQTVLEACPEQRPAERMMSFPTRFNRILYLLVLSNQDWFMQLFCCCACTQCCVTLDPGPVWLFGSFFRLISGLCFWEYFMPSSSWCGVTTQLITSQIFPSLGITSLGCVLSESRPFPGLCENPIRSFGAYSGNCNKYQLVLIPMAAWGETQEGLRDQEYLNVYGCF